MSPSFPLHAGGSPDHYVHGAFIDASLSHAIPTHELTKEVAPPSGCFDVPVEEPEAEEQDEEQSDQPEALQRPPLRFRGHTVDPARDQSFFSAVKLRHYCALVIQTRWRKYTAVAAVGLKQRELAKSRRSRFLSDKKSREATVYDGVRALRKTRLVERVLKLDKDQYESFIVSRVLIVAVSACVKTPSKPDTYLLLQQNECIHRVSG
jgi:hypothetical protein